MAGAPGASARRGSGVCEVLQGARVARLVEAHLAGARNLETRHEPIALVGYRGHELHALGFQVRDRAVYVVAHQEEEMLSDAQSPPGPRVEGELRRGEREDQPAVACIDGGQPENITDERAGGLGVLRKDNGVSSCDHVRSNLSPWHSTCVRWMRLRNPKLT